MLPEDRGRHSRLLRSARPLLDWSQGRLACEAGFSTGTIYVVESGQLDRRSPTVLAVVRALHRGRVAFMPADAGQGYGVRYACTGRGHGKREEVEMMQEEFAERLCQLVGEAEDVGLGLPEMIAVLQDQAGAMWIAYGK